MELSTPFYTPSTAVADSTDQEFEYGAVCGTSFAAPHVAGIATLIWQQNPTWSAGDVREHLKSTAKDLGTTGRDDYFGYGLVDAHSALNTSPPSLGVAISGPIFVGAEGSQSWTATPTGGTGSYTYNWGFRPNGGSWFYVSSQETYQTNVTEDDEPYFDLRVTVTSGGDQASDTHRVNVSIF